MNEHTKHLTAL